MQNFSVVCIFYKIKASSLRHKKAKTNKTFFSLFLPTQHSVQHLA